MDTVMIKTTIINNLIHMKKSYILLLAVASFIGAVSCNVVALDDPQGESGVVMVLNGQVNGYDNAVTKASDDDSTSMWKDGDMLHFSFKNNSDVIPGTATYSSTKGWVISSLETSKLPQGTNRTCEVRYFELPKYQSPYLVTLGDSTIVYESISASYTYTSDTLAVTAVLKPKMGRIRFSGSNSTAIKVVGLSRYTTYSPSANKFSSTSEVISAKVDTSKYTPYIYAFFADSTNRNLSILSNNSAFTRTCGKEVLKSGESGYMAIPTASNYLHWGLGVDFVVNGAKFRMMPVIGHGTGFFLMGETEVTEKLYNRVLSSSSTNSSELPVDYISYSSILSFLEKLNAQTGMTFALPNISQWQYAAKGGNVSQGYTYAGSNNINDVAWYYGNISTKQKVKTKAPNELGIYDMCGNVGEYTNISDAYAYSNYKFPYICGGSYKSSSSYVTVTSKENAYNSNNSYSFGSSSYSSTHSTGSYSYAYGVGFRLFLQIK